MNTKITLKEKVYSNLLADIVNGVYANDTFLSENFLSERYAASRAPVREALTKLTAYGFLSCTPCHGYKVAQISKEKLLEIVRFRSVLEYSFFKENSSVLTPARLKIIRQLCNAVKVTPDSTLLELWRLNKSFHLALFESYGNAYAQELLVNALNLQSLYYAANQDVVPSPTSLHVAVLDYMVKGDAAMAAQLLKADIESVIIGG